MCRRSQTIDDTVFQLTSKEMIRLVFICNDSEFLRLTVERMNSSIARPMSFGAGWATTLPPRWTAPIIASFFVPRPRLDGSKSSRLFGL